MDNMIGRSYDQHKGGGEYIAGTPPGIDAMWDPAVTLAPINSANVPNYYGPSALAQITSLGLSSESLESSLEEETSKMGLSSSVSVPKSESVTKPMCYAAALHLYRIKIRYPPPPRVQEPAMFDRGTRGWFLRTLFPLNLTAEPGVGFPARCAGTCVPSPFPQLTTLTNEHQRSEWGLHHHP